MSTPSRIGAMVMRHLYLLKSSKPRVVELAFWPTFEIVLWGFFSVYLSRMNGGSNLAAQFILGAAVLWCALSRGGAAMMISFMEEMWSRNLGHIFVSPMRPWEFIAGIIVVSSLRTAVGVAIAVLASALLFSDVLVTQGPILLLHFSMLLVMSWSFGLVSMGMILRWGNSAEWLTWMILFGIMPVCCVYFPLSALPQWLQAIALGLPAAHVFEGMRHVISTGDAGWSYLGWALGLNMIWLALTSAFVLHCLNHARNNAALVQQGE